jgi:ABC-type multidrug transport system ATPase subunit
VYQDDVILSSMTVREAIELSAALRLPPSGPGLSRSQIKVEQEARVREIVGLLRLDKCADTLIGSATYKGISGGKESGSH